jgi:hypothetical protein
MPRHASQGPAPHAPDSLPPLYWSAAAPFECARPGGGLETRVLLAGGLDASGTAVADSYELTYDSASDRYNLTTL